MINQLINLCGPLLVPGWVMKTTLLLGGNELTDRTLNNMLTRIANEKKNERLNYEEKSMKDIWGELGKISS